MESTLLRVKLKRLIFARDEFIFDCIIFWQIGIVSMMINVVFFLVVAAPKKSCRTHEANAELAKQSAKGFIESDLESCQSVSLKKERLSTARVR